MRDYRFVQATAQTDRAQEISTVTNLVRVPGPLVQSDAYGSEPIYQIMRAEFIRMGLLTPTEAASASWSYAPL